MNGGLFYKCNILLDASTSSPIYSNDCTTVQPPAIKVMYYIQAKKFIQQGSSSASGDENPSICMPKVDYKKVKIFRHKMQGANHAFTFDKIVDTISDPQLNAGLLNDLWNNYTDANPENTEIGETTFTADDNYFMEIMVKDMVDAERK